MSNRTLILLGTLFVAPGLVAGLSSSTGARAEEGAQISTVEARILEGPLPVPTSGADEGETRWPSQLPADLDSYAPLPLPEPTPPRSPAPDGGRWVSYDPVTGEETLHEPGVIPDFLPESAWTEGGAGVMPGAGLDEERLLQGLKNFTDLVQVTNPEDYPWRVNCKVFITFASGNYVGSGVLIDAMHVLTAGHVVYDLVDGWASSITVVPGYEDGVAPYGSASAYQMHTWTGWTTSGDWQWDMGIIDLNRPVGALTGWHGYGYDNNDALYTGETWNNPGYPAAPPYDGQYLYYWYGNFDAAATHLLTVNRQAYGGQSGSGAYIIDGSNRFVHAELSSGTSTWHQHCRITGGKFSDIGTMISNDVPATFDLWALRVQTNPATIIAGTQLSSMTYRVHNYSSATWSGTVPVTVYLSTNSTISTADTPIQSHSFNHTFGPKSSVDVNVGTPPTIPSDVATGDYYIGVILDVADNSTGNNDSSGDDASPIHVVCPVPVAPSNCLASDAAYCDRVRVTWDDNSADESGFEIIRGTASVGTVGAGATVFSDWSADPCVSYSYKVRAYTDCGTYSGYSNTDAGVRMGVPADPTDCAASDTDPTKIRLTWNDNASGICSETGFVIYRDGNPIGNAPADAEFFDDGNVPQCGVVYNYAVAAGNSCGESSMCGDDGLMPCTADCTVDPIELSFSVDTLGGSDVQTFTITNDGSGTLAGSVTETCDEFDVTPGSYNLGPGEFEMFTVTYTPVDAGDDVCTIEVDAPCENVACTATGPECVPVHFAFDTNTDQTYEITIDSAGIGARGLQAGDEVAVFDGPACVGAVCWSDPPVNLIAWVNDDQCGRPMYFKVWDSQWSRTFVARAFYSTGDRLLCTDPPPVVDLSVHYDLTGMVALAGRPNPLNPDTEITYSLPGENPRHASLKIYNPQGQLVRILVDGMQAGGEHLIHWDGANDSGVRVSSGVYFCVLRSGDLQAIEKLMVVK